MDKKYKYKENDIYKNKSASLWKILSNRYNTSGYLRLLMKKKLSNMNLHGRENFLKEHLHLHQSTYHAFVKLNQLSKGYGFDLQIISGFRITKDNFKYGITKQVVREIYLTVKGIRSTQGLLVTKSYLK